MAVVTPSYAPDFDLFTDLHRSVLAQTPPDTIHHVLVDDWDVPLFTTVASPRCQVRPASSLMPRSFRPVPGWKGWVNLRRPWPPVRGWIAQQLFKISAAASSEADVVLIADSDVYLVRPTSHRTFEREEGLHFYAVDDAVDHERLPRHMLWHAAARRLLGLPEAAAPLPDYVSSFTVWQPAVVRAMQRRIEESTGRRWTDAIASCLHFSEFILYGVFVDEVLERDGVSRSSRVLCLNHWDETPLSEVEARHFVSGMAVDDVAVMISAKSGTDLAVRRAVLESASTASPNG